MYVFLQFNPSIIIITGISGRDIEKIMTIIIPMNTKRLGIFSGLRIMYRNTINRGIVSNPVPIIKSFKCFFSLSIIIFICMCLFLFINLFA